MPAPKLAAAVALVVVSAFVAGTTVRLFSIAGDIAALLSLALLAITVVIVLGIGAKSRRPDTRYW